MKLQELISECNKSISMDIMLYELVFGNSTSVIQDVPVKKAVVDHDNRMVILL